jgi:hypothetical protein
MTGAPKAILTGILAVIDDLTMGTSDIAEAQERLGAYATALDRSAGELSERLRGADADLEEIQFAMLLNEQRTAAVLRLDPLRNLVAAELGRLEASDP